MDAIIIEMTWRRTFFSNVFIIVPFSRDYQLLRLLDFVVGEGVVARNEFMIFD